MSDEPIRNGHVDEDGIQWVKSRCYFCSINCAILVGVKDGKIIKMRPNEDHMTVLCERIGDNGERAIKFHYHPKRINHVLKRAGERGENKWIKIPYEQAMDEIAEKLNALKEKYGPETLAVVEGTYRTDHLWARSRFTNLWGNPGNQTCPGTICWCWMYTVNMAICGFQIELTQTPTIEESNCIVVWGTRPTERFSPKGFVWRILKDTLYRSGKRPRVIVIDPVVTEMVQHSDMFLQVRPGTDLALMLAWCNVILEEKLYHEDFLHQWTNGSFLVRMDTRKLLRECDIVKNGGDQQNFVAWDEKTQKPAIWISSENRYSVENVNNALEGEYMVMLSEGKQVNCTTAYTLLKKRIEEYTPEMASEITSVPVRKIRESARMYATERPGTITWGVGGGDQHGWNATYSGLVKSLLRAFTGNMDVIGGDYIGEPGPITNGISPVRDSELELSDCVTPEAREKFLGNDRFRLMGWKGFELIDKCYRDMWGIPRPQVHQLTSPGPVVWRAMLNDDPYPVRAANRLGCQPIVLGTEYQACVQGIKEPGFIDRFRLF